MLLSLLDPRSCCNVRSSRYRYHVDGTRGIVKYCAYLILEVSSVVPDRALVADRSAAESHELTKVFLWIVSSLGCHFPDFCAMHIEERLSLWPKCTTHSLKLLRDLLLINIALYSWLLESCPAYDFAKSNISGCRYSTVEDQVHTQKRCLEPRKFDIVDD